MTIFNLGSINIDHVYRVAALQSQGMPLGDHRLVDRFV